MVPHPPWRKRPRMDRLFLVDKPYGWSSFQAVEWVKRYFGVKKAGHAGTLDPLATGLLLIATDDMTRQISQLQAQEKEYYALVALGYKTPSDDAEYPPQMVAIPQPLSLEERQQVLERFRGEIFQRPPAFSALKLQGRRSYELARKGKAVDLPPRRVEVYELEEVYYEPPHRWLLRVVTGKGVYIRSLARDIGEVTGWGAYLGALRRTRIGTYSVREALQPDGYLP